LEQGLVLTKIHRVLRFRQAPWMRAFIQKNVARRAVAETDFEKDVFKLMNNAVFGKTMENVRDRPMYELLNERRILDEDRFNRIVQGPYWKSSQLIAHNTQLLGVESYKSRIMFNKPIIVGFTVLDLSKYHMFNFYYNAVKAQYGNKVKLCMTDTDSLVLRIRTPDLYKDLLNPNNKIAPHIDFSNYQPLEKPGCNLLPREYVEKYKGYFTTRYGHWFGSVEHEEYKEYIYFYIPTWVKFTRLSDLIPPNVLLAGHNPQNNKVAGKFKDENGGIPLVEFCGLKPKCYAMLDFLDKSTMKAKGIPRLALKKQFDMEKYKQCICVDSFAAHMTQFNKLVSSKHSILMIQREMRALSGFDSKRYILDDNINTLAFGHKDINSERPHSQYWNDYLDVALKSSFPSSVLSSHPINVQEQKNL